MKPRICVSKETGAHRMMVVQKPLECSYMNDFLPDFFKLICQPNIWEVL
jgi:hypothetical protein